jgi:parallel beta-helix repeat protein
MRRWLAALIGGKPNVASRRRSVRLSVDLLEDRLTPSTLYVDTNTSNSNYHSIQAAVNAANAGDTILVYPGTYTEQVTIGAGKDGLTLSTADGKPDATIQSPTFAAPGSPADVDAAYVVRITAAKGVTLNDFNINGGATTNTQIGVKVDFGASATITNNNVTNIVAPQFSGLGGGAGIDIGEGASNASGVVCSNTITGYGKSGIVVDGGSSAGTKSRAAVAYNTVVGLGQSASFAQYGIQISNGATAEVATNDVSGDVAAAFAADTSGILVFQAAHNVEIEGNYSHGNEFGIWVVSTDYTSVFGNTSAYNHDDGIQLLGANYGKVTYNTSAYNGGDGISVYGATIGTVSAANNTVANNLIVGNAGNGVTIQDASGTKVVDNCISGNGGSAVSITDSTGTKVKFSFVCNTDGSFDVEIDRTDACGNVTSDIVD